jgi:hypothetical protein
MTPLDDLDQFRIELSVLKIDCAKIAKTLTDNSVTPTTAPTATGFVFADRSLWLTYHATLLAQLKTNSLSYPR